MCFQLHSFSRLISSSFSVRSSRFIVVSVRFVMPGLVPSIHVFLSRNLRRRDGTCFGQGLAIQVLARSAPEAGAGENPNFCNRLAARGNPIGSLLLKGDAI